MMTSLNKKGFSLPEVLIATSIFAVVGLIAVTVFVNVIRTKRQVSLENMIYEDARFTMERLAREIRRNTIDYEEYYNKAGANHYGVKYGCYANKFYNPGSDNEFGSLCNNGSDPNVNVSCTIDTTTQDINTGQNPYLGILNVTNKNPEDANAFCDKNDSAYPDCSTTYNLQDELYLINASGTEKTLIAKKQINPNPSEYALSLVRLSGEDNNSDGVKETWNNCSLDPLNPLCCSAGFNCNPTTLQVVPNGEGALEYSLNHISLYPDNYQGFIPISPSRTNVTSLQFIVSPLEDPRKAFAETETDPNSPAYGIQEQPHVTVILTVQPNQNELKNYKGTMPSVTLQSTITSRVYNEVTSFFGNLSC